MDAVCIALIVPVSYFWLKKMFYIIWCYPFGFTLAMAKRNLQKAAQHSRCSVNHGVHVYILLPALAYFSPGWI